MKQTRNKAHNYDHINFEINKVQKYYHMITNKMFARINCKLTVWNIYMFIYK